MTHERDGTHDMSSEESRERAERLAMRAHLLLQPIGLELANGPELLVDLNANLTAEGLRAAREVLPLLNQAYEEARYVWQHTCGDNGAAFSVGETIGILATGVAGALSGSTPVPSGKVILNLFRLAEERYRDLAGDGSAMPTAA